MIVRRLSVVAVLALAALLAAQVGKASAQETVAIQISQHAVFGDMLTDADGNTLYLFTSDELKVSNCSGGCATAWPPLLATGDPIAGEGLSQDRLTTTEREDGSSQVVYNGWPLYYFQNDQAAGDTTGQYGQWFVVSTDGGPIHTNATVRTESHPTLGTILVEASGRSLYLFTNDERNASNCTGGCALAWPPLLTVDDAMAEGSVIPSWLGTTMRPDGKSQVTYNGVPLYYFANDEKPGDTNGQTVGDVWFVVDPIGGAVGMPESTAPTPAPATSGAGVPELISAGDAELPSVGDAAVPSLARWGLISSLALIGVGGMILIRRKPRVARP